MGYIVRSFTPRRLFVRSVAEFRALWYLGVSFEKLVDVGRNSPINRNSSERVEEAGRDC